MCNDKNKLEIRWQKLHNHSNICVSFKRTHHKVFCAIQERWWWSSYKQLLIDSFEPSNNRNGKHTIHTISNSQRWATNDIAWGHETLKSCWPHTDCIMENVSNNTRHLLICFVAQFASGFSVIKIIIYQLDDDGFVLLDIPEKCYLEDRTFILRRAKHQFAVSCHQLCMTFTQKNVNLIKL